jgi:hypothetical protein
MERSEINVVTILLLQNICHRKFVTRVVTKNKFEKNCHRVVAFFLV